MNSFIDEMRRGLCGEESSIKMIPSYVTSLPTGSETGDVCIPSANHSRYGTALVTR